MRKRIINDSVLNKKGTSEVQKWLNIEDLVEVEISSEDVNYPIEAALLSGSISGWRAVESGEQTIRLVFNQPQNIHKIMLKFEEPTIERTQEYVLQWENESGELHEVVRQQWNFSPNGATTQVENYNVDLSEVKVLELKINPNISGVNTVATLQALRIV